MSHDALPENLVRPALADVAPYQPGRPIDDVRRELGLEHITKLASNEGPYPPFPGAIEAIAAAASGTRLYPDPGCWALRDALSARLGVGADRILIGNGVDSLIKMLCLATLDPGDELAMCWPSFISWRQGAAVQGATVRAASLAADGSYDLDALAAQITPRTKLVVVVSPNNPTGQAVSRAALESFIDGLPAHVLAIVDEAYFEYLPADGHDAVGLIRDGRRLVALRTFSKAYGLAGLRVGYMVGPEAAACRAGARAQRLRCQRPRPGSGSGEPDRRRHAARPTHDADRHRARHDRVGPAGPWAEAARVDRELPARADGFCRTRPPR